MIYKLADLYVGIEAKYPYTRAKCKDYRCEIAPRVDFLATVSEAEIDFEKQQDIKNGSEHMHTDAYYEWLAIFRKICAEVLRRDGFMMHGVLLEYAGKGYLFTALSGTGKTTHVRLWQQAFGEENITIVNGDKPFLRLLGNRVLAYGSPWCGKENYNVNKSVPLAGIICLHRAEKNRLYPISADEALPFLMSQIMVTDSVDFARQFEFLGTVLDRIPVYKMECNMDVSAAFVARDGLRKAEREKVCE